MTVELNDHVAFITGASRGIGRACAIRFARAGCDVGLAARSPGALEQTAKLCRNHGADTVAVETDVSVRDDVRAAIDHCSEKLGGLHILVNNAGRGHYEPVDQADLDEWEATVEVNLLGAMYATRYAAPHLKLAAGDGDRAAIINIASISGKLTHEEGGVYCATKHGLVGLSGSSFDDLRERGIKVTALCPGFVDTDMPDDANLDRSKMIQPEDIADTALFVARYPDTGCPTEITIRPQRTPYLSE